MFHPSSLAAFLLSLSATSHICRADQDPFQRDHDYNEADRGRFVQQRYRTSDLEPPAWNVMSPFTNCDDGSYLFMTPRGNMPDATFYIMDHEGSLIWGPHHHYGEVYNFQVQTYKGEQVLVFWAGDDSIGGHGEGKYYMLDKHYEEIKVISADGIRADLHSFQITEDDHAIYTGYEVVKHDLREVGRPKESWIWESLFQELDIETGEVIFEWRASDHFPFLDTYVNPNRAARMDPWDFFHINMVEKDADGNYLVSTRYGRCVLYISGKTKEILWTLGGKRNSFKDLSGGDATTFLGQHDARWYKGHEYITMFDNRADWFHKIEDHSRGQMIKVDLEKMTAELVQSYVHPERILSTSQGSMQVLPNEHVLIGYGFNGAFTEYTWEGEALCDVYFEPSSRWGTGDVQSYRDLKANWTGIPLTTPAIAHEENMLFMSWLGSTKLRSWLIQDSDSADGVFKSVQTTPKRGFETEFDLRSGKKMRRYVRVIAVDEGGTQLSISPPVDLGNVTEIWTHDDPDNANVDDLFAEHEDISDDEDAYSTLREDLEDVQILLILGILAIISAVLIAFMTFGCRSMGFRRLRSEKDGIMGMHMHFRDDGIVRRFWNSLGSLLPSRKKSWRDYAAGGSLLRGRDRGDSMGESGDGR